MSQPTTTDSAAADHFVEAISAAMPPSKARHQRVSADQLLSELNRVPLFMTSLDETDGEGGENMLLEAIKAIAFEGSRLEVAANFREQGNEAARAKLWKDAREFYTKAIQAVRGQVETTSAEGDDKPPLKVQEVIEEEEDPEEEARKERAVEEACLANRALCNLEMSTSSPFPSTKEPDLHHSFIPKLITPPQKTTVPAPATPPPPSASTPPTSKPSTAPPPPASHSTNSPKPSTHALSACPSTPPTPPS
jgi:hypothetical protein